MEIPAEVGVSPTLHIRGMIASRDIKKGENIERCPIILIPIAQKALVDQTVLGNFHFDWSNQYVCFPLGYGALINHSYTPNAEYFVDHKNKCLTFRARQAIKKGEELFVNYNGYPNDTNPVEEKYSDYNQNIIT